MKKKLALLLAFASCFSFAACNKKHVQDCSCTECKEKLEYIFELNFDGTGYVLADIGEAYTGGTVSIPSEYNGKPVVEIGMYAFGNNEDKITSLIVPDSVKSIGFKAFAEQDNLESVTVGNGTVTIESGSFYRCTKLKTVILGNGVEYIYSEAFQYCDALESVTLGNNVKEIAGTVFSYCTSLKSMTIPASIQKIGWSAFGNSGFTDIYFGVSQAGEQWNKEWNDGLENVTLHWA